MSDGAGTGTVRITACGKPFFRYTGDAAFFQSVERDLAERAAFAGMAADDYALGLVLSWHQDHELITEEDERGDFRDALLHSVVSICSRGSDLAHLRELVGTCDLAFNVAILPAEGREVLSVAFMSVGRLN
jgi:hypothetical protein